MRGVARFALALQVAAVLVLVLTQVGASAQSPASSPSPSPSHTGSPTPGSSSPPAASPAASSPSPSQPASTGPAATSTPTAAPTSSPTPPGGGILALGSASSALVAQVGDHVRYRVTVSNPGTAPLDDVFVVDLLPREVTFVSAVISPQAEATLYGRVGEQENITWNIGRVRPGQTITLTWTGSAGDLGDMNALNAVRAVASGVTKQRHEDRTYLASTSTQAGPNPSPQPSRSTVVEVERVPSGAVLGDVEGTAGESLPVTGFDPRLDLALGGLLLAAGGLLWWAGAPGSGRRRKIGVAVAALALLTACTAGRESHRASPATTVSPQVKGKRIGGDASPAPGADEADAGGETGSGDGGRGEHGSGPAGGAGGSDATAPPVPVAIPEAPATTLVRTTHVVLVPPRLRPPAVLDSGGGDNSVTYSWSGDSITAAADSTAFGPPRPAYLFTRVHEASGGTRAVATLSNGSADRPLLVSGRIFYEIEGAAGTATLRSAPVEITLQPGGSTSATFVYDLPPGSYSVSSEFRAN